MNNATTEQGKETRARIYEFVVDYIQQHGYPPTIREIADGVYLSSTASVHTQLLRLFKEGILETDTATGSARAIRVPGYRFTRKEG